MVIMLCSTDMEAYDDLDGSRCREAGRLEAGSRRANDEGCDDVGASEPMS